jgi:starvation-inducible DNA-binding protein
MGTQRVSDVSKDAKEISRENKPDSRVVEHLQRQTGNALVLYLNYKHYHWQITGAQFRDLHLLFDEFAEAVLETLDEFAERVRMIGQDPIFSFDQMQKHGSVKGSDQHELRGMIEEADRNVIRVIREIREAAKAADEANDPGSVDLFSKTVQIHEKHEWWLREIMKGQTV